jgi:glycosyltransferase involved in cell wall biosynthesis
MIADGITGWLVDGDDEQALSVALADAIDDRVERQRRGRAARAVVSERYSWDAVTERFATILEDAAARSTTQ